MKFQENYLAYLIKTITPRNSTSKEEEIPRLEQKHPLTKILVVRNTLPQLELLRLPTAATSVFNLSHTTVVANQ